MLYHYVARKMNPDGQTTEAGSAMMIETLDPMKPGDIFESCGNPWRVAYEI